jgi:uncharacterized protein (TIGR03382 family)
MRRSDVLALALAAALGAMPGAARANGRPPQAMSLHERPGSASELVIGATFGSLITRDNGDTWQWTCEYAVGYGGDYDPDYAMTPAGTLLATTFDGIQINRDGCTYQPSTFGEANASQIAVDGEGNVVVAMVYAGDMTEIPPVPPDHKIYRSTTDGMTFDAGVLVGVGDEAWITLEVAPSDPQRIYLSGYRYETGVGKTVVLFRSDNGGQSFAPLPVTDFTISPQSDLKIAAIAADDPDRVLLRVTKWAGVIGDAFYLTTNGGQDWTEVLTLGDEAPGAVFRANGDAVVGTLRTGIYVSTTAGASFVQISAPAPDAGVAPGPQIACLVERANGELWACTNNYQAEPFGYGVMRSTDAVSWTGVMTFQDDITGPVDCPAGTLQQDCCTIHVPACPVQNSSTWCFLRSQLGIVASPISCSSGGEPTQPPGGGGCCDAGAGPGSALPALLIALGMTRRRRRVTPAVDRA